MEPKEEIEDRDEDEETEIELEDEDKGKGKETEKDYKTKRSPNKENVPLEFPSVNPRKTKVEQAQF